MLLALLPELSQHMKEKHMERIKAESGYGADPRIEWRDPSSCGPSWGGRLSGKGVAVARVHPGDLAAELVDPALNWDGHLYPDEYLEFRLTVPGHDLCAIVLVSPLDQRALTDPPYHRLNEALYLVLGHPRS